MNPLPIDDVTLHAWLDGELPPERHAEIEAWLQAHPEDAACVRLWAADREEGEEPEPGITACLSQ